MQPFNSTMDAIRKLNNSLITYEGRVFRCMPHSNQEDSTMMTLVELVTGTTIVVDYTSNSFQAVPYELGYLNKTKSMSCTFISRSPIRSSHVGIQVSGLLQTNLSSKYISVLNSRETNTQEFVDMLFNRYPSFEETKELVSKSKKSNNGLAFNKSLALFSILDGEDEMQLYLFHNTVRLARLDSLTNKFIPCGGSKNKTFMLNMLAKGGSIPYALIA